MGKVKKRYCNSIVIIRNGLKVFFALVATYFDL
jgi:hypothetical protein